MRTNKLFLIGVALLFIAACNSGNDIASRMKSYMKDTVVARFDDPASYQFVSLRIDTFRGADFIHNLRLFYDDTTLLSSEKREADHRLVDSLLKVPGYTERILTYQGQLSFRGKNKMGALVLDSTRLFFDPEKDAIQQHDN